MFSLADAVSIEAFGNFPVGLIIRIPTAFTPGTSLIFSTGGLTGRSSPNNVKVLYPTNAIAAIAIASIRRFARFCMMLIRLLCIWIALGFYC